MVIDVPFSTSTFRSMEVAKLFNLLEKSDEELKSMQLFYDTDLAGFDS